MRVVVCLDSRCRVWIYRTEEGAESVPRQHRSSPSSRDLNTRDQDFHPAGPDQDPPEVRPGRQDPHRSGRVSEGRLPSVTSVGGRGSSRGYSMPGPRNPWKRGKSVSPGTRCEMPPAGDRTPQAGEPRSETTCCRPFPGGPPLQKNGHPSFLTKDSSAAWLAALKRTPLSIPALTACV